MARLINVIQASMLEQIAADPILGSKLTSPSKVAFYRLITFIVAVAINILEQVIDIYKASIEKVILTAAPGSPRWLQDKILKFQFSSDPDQGVVQIINFAPQYTTVNPALRVVSNCAVVTTHNKECLILVAGGSPPSPLTSDQVVALRSYLNDLGFAGIKYTIRNIPADFISISARVYFDGQYSPVISNNVFSAIYTFISTLPFNGIMSVSSLEDAIQAVQGVTNVVIDQVGCRPYNITDPIIITNYPNQAYQAFAGYLVPDPDLAFIDTITFVAE